MPNVTTNLAVYGPGGYVPQNSPAYRGSPDAAQVLSSHQQASGAVAVVGYSRRRAGARALIGPDGLPLERLNSSAGLVRRSSAEHSIWFPLNSQRNRFQGTLLDFTGTLRGKPKGGSTGRWTPNRGMTFNGSNNRIECNDSDSNAPQFSSFVGYPIEGFTNSALACADWSSLYSRGDMILAWAVISHPAGGLGADGVIASLGMNADPLGKGGWGFGIKSGAAGKVRLWHRGQGASTIDVQDLSAGGVTGTNNLNTRTAIALEISAAGSRYIDVSGYVMTLDDDGGSSQNIVGMTSHDSLANSGTAAVGTSITSPLVLGAMSDSVPISKLTPAGTISTGASNHLTLAANFGAAGPASSTIPYTTGIWMWFGSQATTPALTPKYYWVVFSDLTHGTIYTNGPGSGAINFTVGAALAVPTANFVNYFSGAIGQVGIERRARDFGLGMRCVRDLRGDMDSYPLCLE